jgi:uncharacterized protein YcbK (DUF882 family)
MSKISEHFDRQEFACRCGNCPDSTDPTVDVTLIRILEELRDHFGRPITVTSGSRCKQHNASVGGTPFSKHRGGRASDIIVKGVDPAAVHKYLDDRYPDRYGIGKYDTFTHIDSRSVKARWDLTGSLKIDGT